jgi:hypothetical protein
MVLSLVVVIYVGVFFIEKYLGMYGSFHPALGDVFAVMNK